MLIHMSVAANDPQRVARFLAALWEGRAAPFPPVAQGSWVALSGNEAGNTVEVYPIDCVLAPAAGDADAEARLAPPAGLTATHGAFATRLDRDAVVNLARAQDWPVKICRRGNMFGVIEVWIEGRQMIEVLTPEMQAEYRATQTALWQRAGVSPTPSPGMP